MRSIQWIADVVFVSVRVGLTLIYVEDFAPMFTFYRDVIGLETTRADPGEGYEVGVDWAQFNCGSRFCRPSFL